MAAKSSGSRRDRGNRHRIRRPHRPVESVPVHSFCTLFDALSGIVRNTCRAPGAAAAEPTFEVVTTATAQQRRALDLIAQIKP